MSDNDRASTPQEVIDAERDAASTVDEIIESFQIDDSPIFKKQSGERISNQYLRGRQWKTF